MVKNDNNYMEEEPEIVPQLAEEKEHNVHVPLHHPDLPKDVKLKKRYRKRRVDMIGGSLQQTTHFNEKRLRCEEFGSLPNNSYCFTENTNKEKLVLEHVKKYAAQFHIAYVETNEVKRDRD